MAEVIKSGEPKNKRNVEKMIGKMKELGEEVQGYLELESEDMDEMFQEVLEMISERKYYNLDGMSCLQEDLGLISISKTMIKRFVHDFSLVLRAELVMDKDESEFGKFSIPKCLVSYGKKLHQLCKIFHIFLGDYVFTVYKENKKADEIIRKRKRRMENDNAREESAKKVR